VTPTVDIVIKSYPADYPWLAYALRSLQKFATGFNDIIVLLPKSSPLNLTAEKVVYLDAPEGYLQQQVAKLNADRHTQADYIVHWDSDMIATAPFTPDIFFHNGRPVWTMTPWGDMPGQVEKKAWYHVMAKCLQECPPYEFMRKCAIIAPRWLYAEFRAFIEATHGMTIEAYVMNQPGHEFSEYNCIGFFAWLKHRDKFHWHDTTKDGVTAWPWKQFWSWSGLTPEIKAEIETLLK
jgi:hypothetical protein